MTQRKTTWARLQLLLIAAVFFGPLAVAAWMYYGGDLRPESHTNHGALLRPIVNVIGQLPASTIVKPGNRYWVLVYSNDDECDATCENALYTMRQSRQMLGKEMDRLLRVFLHGESSPDTVFLATEHAGLVTLRDIELAALLDSKKPVTLAAGGYFLIDPLGNLVMYFEPGMDPSDMVEDIQRLLKLSRIG